MTIIEKLIAANIVLNSKKNMIVPTALAKKDIDIVVSILLKGYNLDDDLGLLMKKYKKVGKIPDAKVLAGKKITPQIMQNLMDLVYPKVPHGYLIAIIVQDFRDTVANYISNGERPDMIKALRSLADNMEEGKEIPMPDPN